MQLVSKQVFENGHYGGRKLIVAMKQRMFVDARDPILNSKTVVKTAKFKTLFLKFITTLQLETSDKCKTTTLVSL